MAKKTVVITLESIHLVCAGTTKKKETRHALTSVLIWPRPTIAKKETILTCSLTRGAADLAEAPWHETILFKENVEGKFGLSIEVSEAMSNDVLDTLVRSFASVFLKDASSILGKSDLAFGDLLSTLFSAAGKTGGTPKTKLIAAGATTLDPADIRDGDSLTIPLVAPRALVETKLEPNPADRGPNRTRKTLLAKDAPNGSATLRIHLL